MRLRSWPPLALAVVLLAYWACVLFTGLRARAFDPSDPSEQMQQAASMAAELRGGGLLGWLGAVRSDYLGKPLFHGLLSLGIMAGIPADHAGYKLMTGLMVLLLVLAFASALWRRFGPWPALLAAAWLSGSNAELSQALYGGHSWLGQVLLWAAVASANISAWDTLARSPARSACFGLFLALSVLSSHHMALWISPLLLFWAWRWTSSKGGARPLAGLAAGLAAPLFLLEFLAFSVQKRHYWEALAVQFSAAASLSPADKGLHGYLFLLLGRSESALFLVLLGLAAAAGALHLWRGWRRGDPACALHLFYPLVACAVLEAPQLLRLGRLYFPALPFVFVWAGVGAARLLERLREGAPRAAAGWTLAALILLCGLGPRIGTRRAFHAGKTFGDGGLIVAGRSLPYIYLPDRELRVTHCRNLAAAIRSGGDRLLVSRYSHWFWRSFLDKASFDIPVEEAFASGLPYRPVPGVESVPFELFTNEVLGRRLLTGGLPFPEPNRLYRACDFAAWAIPERCLVSEDELRRLRSACGS
jgi:hypothetical protein